MNQGNNYNIQGSNGVPNNQPLNANKIIGYDSQTGQPIYETQNVNMYQYSVNNMNFQQSMLTKKPKKKKYWLIPVLIFTLMVVAPVIAIMLKFAGIESSIISSIAVVIQLVCGFAVVPSIIIAIVLSVKKAPEEKTSYNLQMNNAINSSNSLDEKLLIAYIGNNYEKIMQKKFSVSALFLSWIYTLYRKVYIPSIIGIIAIIILGFLPEQIFIAIILVFVMVLGINFNKWYIAYAKKQIEKIKINNPNVNANELINICRKNGGTNIWSPIVVFIVICIIGSITTI